MGQLVKDQTRMSLFRLSTRRMYVCRLYLCVQVYCFVISFPSLLGIRGQRNPGLPMRTMSGTAGDCSAFVPR